MESMKRRSLLLASGGALIFSFTPWSKALGAGVVDVRLWPATDYTRLTIEHDSPLKFRYFMMNKLDPCRLVVDIDGLLLTPSLEKMVKEVRPDDPYIAAIRIGQNTPRVVRLAIDFKSAVVPQVFSLKPVGNYKYRLVFDIYPAEAKDPLMAAIERDEKGADPIERLLAQVAEGKQRMEQTRAEIGDDSIGDLIADITAGKIVASSDSAPTKSSTTEKGKSRSLPSKSREPEKKAVPARKRRMYVIAIDPGHGGEDPGAVGRRGIKEKDVVLAVSRILFRELNRQEGFKAVLTRDGDYFVPLHRRVQKARAAKADLFISVHADAWIKPAARGSSIFALNSRGKVSSANKWLAKNQNDADLIGGVNLKSHDRQIASILMDLSFTAQINDSLNFGAKILTELEKINILHKSHVEQANFAVLKAPDIPSVLVETAFLSNPQEEQKLRTVSFQRKLAYAIGNGVLRSFNKKPVLG